MRGALKTSVAAKTRNMRSYRGYDSPSRQLTTLLEVGVSAFHGVAVHLERAHCEHRNRVMNGDGQVELSQKTASKA